MSFCTSCGKPSGPNTAFCGTCGAKAGTPAPNTPAPVTPSIRITHKGRLIVGILLALSGASSLIGTAYMPTEREVERSLLGMQWTETRDTTGEITAIIIISIIFLCVGGFLLYSWWKKQKKAI
ncbi:MAG: hypothetical protein FWE08_04460 [Oscillospiraceae bacterium]|nr:hypothetical protein [Oscillospiraceae bacterium]